MWKKYNFLSPYIFAANSPISKIDKGGKNADDVVNLSLADLGKREGYVITTDVETHKTIILRTEVMWMTNGISDDGNALDYKIEETAWLIDREGEVISKKVYQTDVSAEVEKAGVKLLAGEYKYELIKNDVGKRNEIQPKEEFDPILKSVQKVKKSFNSDYMVEGNNRFTSNLDKIENNVEWIVKIGLTIGFAALKIESFGAEKYIDYDIDKANTFEIPKDKKYDALNIFNRESKKLPVIEMSGGD